MPLVVTEEGDLEILGAVLVPSYYMGLFQNNITPDPTLVLADLTPADFSGYNGLVQIDNWSTPVIVNGHAKSIASLIEWAHDGGVINNDIYGYYVVDATQTKLLWLQLDPNPPVVMQPGSPPYQVIPVFTFTSEFT